MITIQWVVYMVVVCCALFGVLFLLYSFMAKQTAKHEEDEVNASPMTSEHDRDDIWEDKTAAADDHLDKMDDLEKNKKEESEKE
jgi:flagellar biosynthesis/type III secretory pathway M-ring protein FliF/YscJ